MSQIRSSESGQIVLISLLILTIATTIGLSLIGRTTTDVAISTQIEESTRAFSAAEAGIEETLKSGVGSSGTVLTPGITYDVAVAQIGAASGVYEFSKKTLRGSIENLWLVNHNADGTLNEVPTYTAGALTLCWTSESTTPAIITTILYKRAGVYSMAKGAYDPDAARAADNKFSGVTTSSGGCGNAGMYGRTITFSDFGIDPVTDTIILLRLRPVYSDTQMAINASMVLPSQGNRVESTGVTAAGIARKILVLQQYRSASSLFDATIYSHTSLEHVPAGIILGQ